MPNRSIILLVTVAVGLIHASATLPAQETPPDPPADGPAIDAETMKKWLEMAAPGEHHKFFKQFVGEWETTSQHVLGGADEEPATSTGTAKFRVIFDGRFLAQTAEGDLFGMKFQGMGLTGYDNVKQKYTTMWIDSASTAMYTAEGNLDDEGKVLSLFGTMDDPATGKREQPVKFVWRIETPDRFVFQFHDLAKGTKSGEIVYVRSDRLQPLPSNEP